MMKRTSALVLAALMMLGLSSCLYDERAAAGTVSVVERPDMVLIDATCTLAQGSERPIDFTAGRMSWWMDEGRMELQDVAFTQADEEGGLSLRGRCDMAQVDTDLEIVNMSGSVEIESISESLSIFADHLIFDTGSMRIESDGDVSIGFSDGTVSGHGLSADLNRRSLSLGGPSQGGLVL